MAAKSIEAALQEVLDREEIRTLPVRYCHTRSIAQYESSNDTYTILSSDDRSLSLVDAFAIMGTTCAGLY
jgi:hypothetical protein